MFGRTSIRRTLWLTVVVLVAACTRSPDVTVIPDDASPRVSVPPARDIQPTWAVTYDGPEHKDDEPNDIVLSRDGATAFVSGFTLLRRCNDFTTIAYDTTDGSERWVARYERTGRSCGDLLVVAGIALSPDDKTLFVVATSYGTDAGESDITTIAYDTADGSRLWVASEEGPISAQDYAVDIVTVSDAVYVTGRVETRCFQRASYCKFAMATAAYDGRTGNRQWFVLHLPGKDSLFASDMVAAPDGRAIYVTGVTDRNWGTETVAYDPTTGVERWTAQSSDVGGPIWSDHDHVRIDVSRDGGSVLVAGGMRHRYGIVAYAADTGAEVWMAAKGRGSDMGTMMPTIVTSPSADVLFFTAQTRRDYLTLAVDAAAGRTLWRSRYDGEGKGDAPWAIAVNGDGSRLYVTGTSQPPGCKDCGLIATEAFDAVDGRVLWTDRYDSGGLPAAIVASGHHDAYLVGFTSRDETSEDFVTLKYTAQAA